MAFKFIPANSLDQVAAGSLAKLKLDIGPTYEKILFEVTSVLGGLTAASIEYVNVVINGNKRIEYLKLQDLIDLNAFYGRRADIVGANRISFMLNFFSSQFDSVADALTTALGTQDLSSLVIEVKIAAGAPADIKIEADLFIETSPQPLGAFLAVKNFTANSAVSGEVQIRDLAVDGAVYTALHFQKADISKVKLTVTERASGATIEIIDSKKTTLEAFLADNWKQKRAPVSARFTHVDFTMLGLSNNVLNTGGVSSLKLATTFGSAGNMNILAETLERL